MRNSILHELILPIILSIIALVLTVKVHAAPASSWEEHTCKGTAAFHDGLDDQAAEQFSAALKEAEKSSKITTQLSVSLDNLGHLYYMQGKFADAETLYRRSLCLSEEMAGRDSLQTANNMNNLVAALRRQGKLIESELLIKRVLNIRERNLGEEHPLVANSLLDLAVIYHRQGKHADAEPFCKRAFAIRQRMFGKSHRLLIPVLDIQSKLLRKMKREDEALETENHLNSIKQKIKEQTINNTHDPR